MFLQPVPPTPVIGVHPNLTQSLHTFTKWIGANVPCNDILNHLWDYGFKAYVLGKSETTEIMKLWDTTYYGMCLAINAEVKTILENHGIEYQLWIRYIQAYNEGYESMGMPNVIRPYFPNLKMPIGGHCIIPNFKILEEITDMSGFNLLKKYGDIT